MSQETPGKNPGESRGFFLTTPSVKEAKDAALASMIKH